MTGKPNSKLWLIEAGDENETYSRHESQKFSDGQSFSKTASMPHSSSEKISALSEPDSTRLTELDPNHEVVAGSKRTSSNPVKSTISEGPTQLYYTDMEAVNDFVRRRWESFTSKPRSEILGHLMTIILPNQRKYHPYTKHKESTSASPPWWPTQKVKWGSPCRMMDSGWFSAMLKFKIMRLYDRALTSAVDKYELLTFLFMAPYRAPEFVEDFLRNPPSPGSDLFPNWKAVLKKAFSKCHMRKDGSNRDNGKTKARQSKGSDDSSVKIEQRKRSVQFLLEVAEDVENIMTNKTGELLPDCCARQDRADDNRCYWCPAYPTLTRRCQESCIWSKSKRTKQKQQEDSRLLWHFYDRQAYTAKNTQDTD